MYRFASRINREQNQIKENKNKPLDRKMVTLGGQQISKRRQTSKINEKMLNLITNLGHSK